MPYESLNVPYLTVTGVVFLTIVATFAVYKPQYEELRATQKNISDLSARLTEKQRFLQSIDQKSAELAANAAAEQELSVVLPPDESFEDLLRIIDRHAGTAAVRITNVTNTTASTQSAQRVAQAIGKDITTPPALTTHGVTISLEGSYQQIRQFINLMENAIRFMDISAINLTASNEQLDLLQGTLTAQFYSLASP